MPTESTSSPWACTVSLSPANFETWLRDTQLVDVDEQRFRIAVPNGFAKDWLESRYRSLISQTLARIVGYSVQVESTVSASRAPDAVTPADLPVDTAPAQARPQVPYFVRPRRRGRWFTGIETVAPPARRMSAGK